MAGAHRLRAFKMMGLDQIWATVTTLSELDAELVEIDENLIRVELTAAQRAKYTAKRKRIYLAKHPETGHGKAPKPKTDEGKAKREKEPKIGSFASETSKASGRSKSSVKQDVVRGEKVDDALLDDISGTDLDSGANFDVLVRLPHERQREVVEHAKEKGIDNLKAAKKSLEKDESIKDIEEEPASLPEGPFRVIVADPPWPYDRTDDPTHRGSITYHKMTMEQICALEVEAMAHDDCVLWLWTTNSFMRQAFEVIDAWGFEEKTILTWVKTAARGTPKMGTGNWLRNASEHCIVAVRGSPMFDLTNQTTVLEAPVREHSRKPEWFFEMVEELCPGSKVELFAREERENWSRWGSETGRFSGAIDQERPGDLVSTDTRITDLGAGPWPPEAFMEGPVAESLPPCPEGREEEFEERISLIKEGSGISDEEAHREALIDILIPGYGVRLFEQRVSEQRPNDSP